MSTLINIFHNVAQDGSGRPLGMLDGYDHTHPLVLVAQVRLLEAGNDLDTAEDMFRLFNVGDDPAFGTPDPTAVAYRARQNRSLSTGDVVEIDGRAYAVARSGYTQVEQPLSIIHSYHSYHDYGTNSIN